MEGLINKAMGIAAVLVFGMFVRHPLPWRNELLRLELKILKDSQGSWGTPSIWRQKSRSNYNSRHAN